MRSPGNCTGWSAGSHRRDRGDSQTYPCRRVVIACYERDSPRRRGRQASSFASSGPVFYFIFPDDHLQRRTERGRRCVGTPAALTSHKCDLRERCRNIVRNNRQAGVTLSCFSATSWYESPSRDPVSQQHESRSFANAKSPVEATEKRLGTTPPIA